MPKNFIKIKSYDDLKNPFIFLDENHPMNINYSALELEFWEELNKRESDEVEKLMNSYYKREYLEIEEKHRKKHSVLYEKKKIQNCKIWTWTELWLIKWFWFLDSKKLYEDLEDSDWNLYEVKTITWKNSNFFFDKKDAISPYSNAKYLILYWRNKKTNIGYYLWTWDIKKEENIDMSNWEYFWDEFGWYLVKKGEYQNDKIENSNFNVDFIIQDEEKHSKIRKGVSNFVYYMLYTCQKYMSLSIDKKIPLIEKSLLNSYWVILLNFKNS